MFGERGKIGLIVPSNNTVVEREFNQMLPEDYVVVATRMWNTSTSKDALENMADQAERGARELSTAEVNVVAFACTSGSFMNGAAWEAELQKKLEDAAGCPVVTTSSAFINALRALELKSVVVATPYPDDINDLERAYIEEHGIAVPEIRGLGIEQSVKIGHCAPMAAQDLALQLDYQQADGIFISCTAFRTIHVIENLERQTGKPVVSSNQATFWQCLRTLGHDEAIAGYGQLLHQFAPTAAGQPNPVA